LHGIWLLAIKQPNNYPNNQFFRQTTKFSNIFLLPVNFASSEPIFALQNDFGIKFCRVGVFMFSMFFIFFMFCMFYFVLMFDCFMFDCLYV